MAANISTLEYKALEVILQAGYDTAADLWSLACSIYELATGRYLLDPRRTQARPQGLRRAALREEPEHLAQVVELVGPLPGSLLKRCGRLEAFLTREEDSEVEEWSFLGSEARMLDSIRWRLGRCRCMI